MSKPYTTRTTCRVCGSGDLAPLFSLGEQYVSDFVSRADATNLHRCPIDIELCRSCTLVQAKHTAPQELLYSRHYWYRSGVTETMRRALANVVRSAEDHVDLYAGDVVLDIGSNDGTLLRFWGDGLVRVGVEPANNFRDCYEGLVHIPEFWSYENYQTSQTVSWGGPKKAKVITACGMFYDLEDPNQFIASVAKVLAPDGVFIAQLMCLKQTLEAGDVGNFAHEHLEFYSLRSLTVLLDVHGLGIFDVEENDVNGGSYRVYCCHKGSRFVPCGTDASKRVVQAFSEEIKLELDNPVTYRRWLRLLLSNRDRCVEFIRKEVARGKKVWVYGASTKGNVILQWYGLDDGLISAAADRSPEKWGRFTVGTGIPIKSEAEFREAKPDYALVLPYAFLTEFVERERDWLTGGGMFLVPLPEFKVVGKLNLA